MSRERPFKIYAELEAFEKGDDENPMRIGGVVSTDDLDQDGERILQEGLDFGHFLSKGWFNDNHGKRTVDVVGYPTGAQYVRKGQRLPNGKRSGSNGWWAEGYLCNTSTGRDLWGLVQSLEKGPRKLGFSIEGKVKQRHRDDPTIVAKAEVHHVAVTHVPVNTRTELGALAKALTAGSAIANPGASPGEGFALRGESLDSEVYDQEFAADDVTEDEPTTTEGDHETTEDEHEPFGKAEDFVIEPITEAQYLAGWIKAAHEVADPHPDTFSPDEARLIVKAERPELTDAEIDRVITRARRAQEHA